MHGLPYKTVVFHTLGCKLNFAETSTLAQDFINSGYSLVNFHDPADVYIINSCSVTDNADKKSRKPVRQALKRSPLAKIAIVGFPGERDSNFQQSFDFLETMNVSYLHVFSYLERDYTNAINIPSKVKYETIMERNKILHSLSKKKKINFIIRILEVKE